MIEISATIDGVSRNFKFDPSAGRDNFPALDQITERMDDLTPILDEIHDILLELQRKVFDTQGAAIGKRWVDYNSDERKAYVPMKRAILGSEYPMLRWEGGKEQLYPSLTNKRDSKHIWNTTKQTFEFGTSVAHAAGLHDGTGKGWRNAYTVPARPLIGSNWKVLGEIIREIQGYVFGHGTQKLARGGIFG